jgi:superfamily II DNA helicase RecQ
MGLFKKIFNLGNNVEKDILKEANIDKPIFVKEFSKENEQITDLEKLADLLKEGDKKSKIIKDIYYLKQGISGENNVYYELKNSFLPILCLHDIRIEYDGYVAQLDFVVISSRYICILETKKLNGNIKINNQGDFIRIFNDNNKQGMYSPVSQNRRHVNIIKHMISKELNINDIDMESLVVMANAKTIINMNEASEDIKNSIVKYDQVITYLNKMHEKNDVKISLDDMKALADFLIKNHKPITFNYLAKYCINNMDYLNCEGTTIESNSVPEENIVVEDDANELFEKLRLYRSTTAKAAGYDYMKYHFIFSNSVIEQIIENMPDTLEELYEIKGLGQVKIERYGKDILKILKNEEVHIETEISKAKEQVAATKDNNIDIKTIAVETKIHNRKVISNNSLNQNVKTEEQLIDGLKKYRLEKSKELNIKPYFIFNNEEMGDIIAKKPKNKEELLKMKGFGPVKVEKYGEDILRILC